MGQGISKVTKDELIQAISKRYQDATRSEKGGYWMSSSN